MADVTHVSTHVVKEDTPFLESCECCEQEMKNVITPGCRGCARASEELHQAILDDPTGQLLKDMEGEIPGDREGASSAWELTDHHFCESTDYHFCESSLNESEV